MWIVFPGLMPWSFRQCRQKISLGHRSRQSPTGVQGNRAGNTARDQSGSGTDVYVLKGLKEDVLSVIELVNRAIQKALCQDLQDKEEATLALDVQWSIQDTNGAWNELSLRDNYLLEEAHMKKQVSVDMTAPNSMMMKVNLMAQEATNWQTGVTYKIKKNETKTSMLHFVVFTFKILKVTSIKNLLRILKP